MRSLWILATSAACAMLAGCVAYQPKPLDPARLQAGFEARSLDDPALRACMQQQVAQPLAAWPVKTWDTRMLALAAACRSPLLAGAREQWRLARAAAEAAGARPDPVLDFPFEFELNHSGAGRPFTAGPVLTWTFETGGKAAARSAQAVALAEAARWKMVDTAWKLRSQVRASLLGVHVQQARVAVLADKADSMAGAAAMLEVRLQTGAVARPELRRGQLQLSQARTALAAEQTALASARVRLAGAVGVPVAALDGIALDTAEFERTLAAPDARAARRSAILNRADLQAALAEYEAAQDALRLEVARQYPDIHLGTGYTYDAGADKINLGLGGITLPLFGAQRAAIAQAEAQRAAFGARVEALQQALFNELEARLARVREGTLALALARAQAQAAARQRDSVAGAFVLGAADRLELTLAHADYQAFLLERIDAMAALQEAAGQLEDALQQPLGAAP